MEEWDHISKKLCRCEDSQSPGFHPQWRASSWKWTIGYLVRLRCTGSPDQATSQPPYARQARNVSKLAVESAEHYQQAEIIPDCIAQCVGSVGIKDVVPPVSIPDPTTSRQALPPPYTLKWGAAMRDELQSTSDYDVADTKFRQRQCPHVRLWQVSAGYSRGKQMHDFKLVSFLKGGHKNISLPVVEHMHPHVDSRFHW